MSAEASGKNVAIKLDFPPGSTASYTAMGSAGKVERIVDHTESPFKLTFPPEREWSRMAAVARLRGPGTVKAKAWN